MSTVRIAALSVVVALVASALVLATTAQSAGACSCATRRGDDAGAFDRADAVFTGVLVEVRTPAGSHYSADPERFVFDVGRVYKGTVFARQSVVTAREGGSCGLEVAQGVGEILVFARRQTDGRVTADDGEVVADLCGGTRYAIDPVPASFGDGAAPRDGSSPIGGPSIRPVAVDRAADGSRDGELVLGLVAVAVALLAAATVRVRRRAARSS